MIEFGGSIVAGGLAERAALMGGHGSLGLRGVAGQRGLAFIVAALVCVSGLGSVPVVAQTIDSTTWCVGPGDRVFATASRGDTLFIGGNFSQLGPASGGGTPIDLATGRATTTACRVAGSVFTVLPDGSGGWYIGGAFSAVGGRPHKNLAHIRKEGPDDTWRPDANGEVDVLALDGGRLYVGGEFDSLAGLPRSHLAAVAVSTGAVEAWDPGVNNRVSTIAPRGSVVYVGGWFTTVGGQTRQYAAAIDSANGVPTAWNPSPNDFVFTLAVRDTSVFMGGAFTSVSGTYRFYLAKVGSASGALSPWDAQITRKPDYLYDGGPRVCSVVLRDSTLFAAGYFSAVAGQPRQGLAEISIATAALTAWNPQASAPTFPGASFTTLALRTDTLFVAGYATNLGGQPCDPTTFSAVSATSGARITWDPRPNGGVDCMALQSTTLFTGGRFSSMGEWVARRGLAALDLRTGLPTAWDPETDSYVQAMGIRGNTVYVGGPFSSVGGMARSGLAALDGVTGKPTAWHPSVTGSVTTLAFTQGGLLIGGLFSSAGGQPRMNAAELDTVTGQATAWDPEANDMVMSVTATDSVIYLGGNFTQVGGNARSYIAAVDATVGATAGWSPVLDGWVNAIALSAGTIYLAGDFNTVDGFERDGLAAIGPDGLVKPWTANASRQVYTLAASDSTIYAGGGFSTIDGASRFCIAAISARTGAVRDWYPAPDGVVWSVAIDHGSVIVGGAFMRMGNWPQAGLAIISPADAPVRPSGQSLWLAQSCPNPATSAALIRYVLPESGRASMVMFDIQGRQAALLLPETYQEAGQHVVAVPVGHLKPGCYFYRLEEDGAAATKKMLVVK